MGAMYAVTMQNQTVVADATLIIVRTAAAITTRASMIRVHRAWVEQQASETSDQLGCMIAQKASAFGTYTSTTPTPLVVGGAASGIAGGTSGAAATAGTDASAEGAGTVTPIYYSGFNNLNGREWIFVPEERLIIPVDTAFIVKLVGTPAALGNWSAGAIFEEIN